MCGVGPEGGGHLLRTEEQGRWKARGRSLGSSSPRDVRLDHLVKRVGLGEVKNPSACGAARAGHPGQGHRPPPSLSSGETALLTRLAFGFLVLPSVRCVTH